METIIIYTDGGCRGNPGPGGWAYILKVDSIEKSRSGGDPYTTNNKMELTAVIRSLETVLKDSELSKKAIELHTDSQYVKNGISSWINNWIRNGWMTAAKKPVKNKELWIELKEVSDKLNVTWKWVKGHAGDSLNETCDQMVNEEMNKL
ncbi:MAG: ribonuclease HI [Spirochaetia bacterium]|nr:ribonuclease HI [Spirochaetia bacterium]